MSVKTHYVPRVILTVPWADDSDACIPHQPFDIQPISGMVMTQSRRKARPLYDIRADHNGGLCFLIELPQGAPPIQRKYRLFFFDNKGRLHHTVKITANIADINEWDIIDFHADGCGGIYLLERLHYGSSPTVNRIRRLSALGTEQWNITGPVDHRHLDFNNLRGRFDYLLSPERNALFLPAIYPQQGLAEFNVSDGTIRTIHRWDEQHSKLSMGNRSEVCYPLLIQENTEERIVLVIQDLVSGQRKIIKTDIQNLHNMAGIDREGGIYPRIPNGIACMSPCGKLQWQHQFFGIVAKGSQIYVCRKVEINDELLLLDVDIFDSQGALIEQRKFSLEQGDIPENNSMVRLVDVNQESEYTFCIGETAHKPGVLFRFDSKGVLETKLSLMQTLDPENHLFDATNQILLPMESRTAVNFLEIDNIGNILVPLSDPEGFKVICWEKC